MKLKAIIFLSIGTILIVLLGFMFGRCSKKNEFVIAVNDKEIRHRLIQLNHNYATIPLFETLVACGISIEWANQNQAILSAENNTMIFELDEMQLVAEQNGNNYLLPPPGCSYHCCEYVDGVLIVDDATLHSVLFQLGIKTEIDINYRKGVISIKQLD